MDLVSELIAQAAAMPGWQVLLRSNTDRALPTGAYANEETVCIGDPLWFANLSRTTGPGIVFTHGGRFAGGVIQGVSFKAYGHSPEAVLASCLSRAQEMVRETM